MRPDAMDLLRGIPLFRVVPDDELELLTERIKWRWLEAGQWLFHEGDPADELFIVAHGSLELLSEEPERVHAIYGRGQALGELALLTGRTRNMSVRARRDAQLASVGREDFDRLLETHPQFAVALVRVLADRLHESRPKEPPHRQLKALALVPLHDGAPIDSVADELVRQLRQFGQVNRLDRHDRGFSFASVGDQWTLLVARSHDTEDSWTRYCIRQVDRVISVATRGTRDAPAPRASGLRGCELAFGAPAVAEPDIQGWISALEPRAVHVWRHGSPDGIARMTRRLAGRAVGVVLSGGGARAIAHIGVIEELMRAGVVIDRIGGTSMGAMIASLFAEGRGADEVAQIVEALYVKDTPLRGRTIPLVSLSRGEIGLARQHELHGQRRIENLDIPFFCVSSDLVAQCMVVHRQGLVADAVSASQALPAFVPPLKDGDRLLVDGAIFNNLPVEPMLSTGEGPVIAVDVSGRLPIPRPSRARVPFLRRWIVGPAVDWAPNISETVLRSILLGSAATDAAARGLANVVVQPRLRGISTMRFRDVEGIRRLGREAAREALDAGALDAIMARTETPTRTADSVQSA